MSSTIPGPQWDSACACLLAPTWLDGTCSRVPYLRTLTPRIDRRGLFVAPAQSTGRKRSEARQEANGRPGLAARKQRSKEPRRGVGPIGKHSGVADSIERSGAGVDLARAAHTIWAARKARPSRVASPKWSPGLGRLPAELAQPGSWRRDRQLKPEPGPGSPRIPPHQLSGQVIAKPE